MFIEIDYYYWIGGIGTPSGWEWMETNESFNFTRMAPNYTPADGLCICLSGLNELWYPSYTCTTWLYCLCEYP